MPAIVCINQTIKLNTPGTNIASKISTKNVFIFFTSIQKISGKGKEPQTPYFIFLKN